MRTSAAFTLVLGLSLPGLAQAQAPQPSSSTPPTASAKAEGPETKAAPAKATPTKTTKTTAADVELRKAGGTASLGEKLAASLGFGTLAGLGLPIIILTGGAMRHLGLDPPDFIAKYIDPHSPLYDWPFLLLAMLSLVLVLLSGNEKLSKGPKLLAQIAAVPPTVILAVAVPIISELNAGGGSTALLVQAGEGVVAGAAADGGLSLGSVAFAILLGLTSLATALLLLLTRLLVSFLVWVSPFPFVDALVNVAFHAYAAVLIILTFVAPPVALALMIIQLVVALILVRRLFRFARTTAEMGAGAFLWHFMRGSLDEVLAEERDALRLEGWSVAVPKTAKHLPLAVQLSERKVTLLGGRERSAEKKEIGAYSLYLVMARTGAVHDEIVFVEKTGQGKTRKETSWHLGFSKRQRKRFLALLDELEERGYEVIDLPRRGAGAAPELAAEAA